MLLFPMVLFMFSPTPYCSFSLFHWTLYPPTPPTHTHIPTFVVCLWLLQGCCNFPSGSHLSQGSLLSMFSHMCYWTKIHTHVSNRVSLHTYLEIVVKFVSYLSNYWGWPSYNEIDSFLFLSFFSTNLSAIVIAISVFLPNYIFFLSFYFFLFVLLPPYPLPFVT
jgi:hypothetical protein